MTFVEFVLKMFAPRGSQLVVPLKPLAPSLLNTVHVEAAKPVVIPVHGVGIRVDHLLKMGVSQANALKYVGYLNEACQRYDINTKARLAAFIAQICEESGNLSITEENLHYTEANILAVWGNRFTPAAAQAMAAGGPVAVADAAYGYKMGNSEPQDGYKYRGRGFIQLTFKNNYLESGQELGVDLVSNPDLVCQPEYCALTAADFWKRAGCNQLADPNNDQSLLNITRRINGGYVNLDTRRANWKKALTVFSDLK